MNEQKGIYIFVCREVPSHHCLKVLCKEVSCPGNKFKMNQKLPDWTFDQSLHILCND